MITFDTTIIFSAGAIVGALAVKIVDHFLAQSRNTEDRKIKGFNQAASTFRSKLLALLEGYYPSIHSCGADDYAKIRATIPKVESISADFSHFLRGSAKSKFHAAVKEYCEYCKNINRTNDTARAIYNHPSRPKSDNETEPLTTGNLTRHVDELLSFAKEK